MRHYAKHYDTVSAIEFDGSQDNFAEIVEMCKPCDFRLKIRTTGGLCGLLEVREMICVNHGEEPYVEVEVGNYVVREPNGFCYSTPAMAFNLTHSEMTDD